MLSNWFLAATPQHVVMQAWAQACREHWSGRTTPDAYFWHHRLFAAVHERDPMVRAAWDTTPKVCADGPHAFAPYEAGLLEPIDEPRRRMLDARANPVYKLTHKLPDRLPVMASAYAAFVALVI
jgi:hypothetical protein